MKDNSKRMPKLILSHRHATHMSGMDNHLYAMWWNVPKGFGQIMLFCSQISMLYISVDLIFSQAHHVP